MRPELKKMQDVMERKGGRTARELAQLMRCSTPTVYRRIEALREAGAAVGVLTQCAIGNKTGPCPVKFFLDRRAADE